MLPTSSNHSNLNNYNSSSRLVNNQELSPSKVSDAVSETEKEKLSFPRQGTNEFDAEIQSKSIIGKSLITNPIKKRYRNIPEALRESLQNYSQENNKPVDYEILEELTMYSLHRVLNTIRDLYPGINLDFSFTDMSDMEFHELDFQNCNFYGANLSGAKLRNVNFSGANFDAANLKQIDVMKGDFRNVNFTNADMSDVEIIEADFKEANFKNANLANSKIGYSNFSNVKSNNASNFDNLFLEFCNLDDTDLGELSVKDLTISFITSAKNLKITSKF